MNRWLLWLILLWGIGVLFCLDRAAQAAEKAPADRGREIMFYRSLNPPIWSLKAYENVWKQWGLAAKPDRYAEAFMDRYGLYAAPFENNGRPMGLMEARGLFGKGIVNNCLLCHAGSVAGQTIIGLGNAALDLQSLFEELSITDGFKAHFWEQRKIYDTTRPGRGKGGHTFGDDLSDPERMAVIEYLKTL